MQRKAICTVLASGIAVGGFVFWPKGGEKTSVAISAPIANAAVIVPSSGSIELQTAVLHGSVQAKFRGNGREKMRVTLNNAGARPLKVQVEAGQMFEAGANAVIIARDASLEVPAGSSAELPLQTIATCSTNNVTSSAFSLSQRKESRLNPLLTYAKTHPEVSLASIQTAALALTENLPLSAVCKFTSAAGELKSRFNTDAFRVETADILTALIALREIGLPDSAIAMTIDPQLKIEAMIEPVSRVAAMRYYGITADNEWEYWKTELLSGAASTRHYALYGIARFYPEIALQMLPKWARESKTNTVYRVSAVQALADTQRSEALPLLRQLSEEFGTDTELGNAAAAAAKYLNDRLTQLAGSQPAIAFRASQTISQF